MNWKIALFGLTLAAIVPFASAACQDINYMPSGSWTWSAWLCTPYVPLGRFVMAGGGGEGVFYGTLHGRIETTAPPGHPNASSTWWASLESFTYSSPYPATLKCYKRMGVSGNYWYWYTGQQVTLYAGGYTPSSSSWVQYGCPPVKNNGQLNNPPQVNIAVAWSGFGAMMRGGNPQVENAVLPPMKKTRRK